MLHYFSFFQGCCFIIFFKENSKNSHTLSKGSCLTSFSEQSNFGKMSPAQLIIFGAFQAVVSGQTSSGESDIVTLQCPFGSKLTVQSSYCYSNRMDEKSSWISWYCTNDNNKIAACVTCEYDSFYNPHDASKVVEICSYTQSNNLNQNHLYRIQSYFWMNNCAKRYSKESFCAIQLFRASDERDQKYPDVLNISTITCNTVNNFTVNNYNPFGKLKELHCPIGSQMYGFEERNSFCSNQKAFCILCRSMEDVYSVCYSNCEQPYHSINFNKLIIEDSTLLDLSYLTTKKSCGFQIEENNSVLELKNENAESLEKKSLLCTNEADQGKSIYSSVQADTKDDIQRSIYIGVISTCGFVIVILTLAICHLKRKLNSFTSKADEDRNNVMNSSFNIIDTTQPDLQNVHTRRPAYQFSFNPYFQ